MTAGPSMPTSGASSALAQVVAGLERLAAVPGWQAGEGELSEALAGLDHVGRLAQAQSTRLLAEVSARGLPGRQGHARLEHWLRAQVPTTSPHSASALARRAERL